MKRFLLIILIAILLCLCGCDTQEQQYQIVATTLPVYDFTTALCSGTDLTVGQLVTEQVSCLHDYSLSVSQMRMLNSAELIVISGAGLEDFLDQSLFEEKNTIDASAHVHIHSAGHHHEAGHAHAHDTDPHIWLSPENAKAMCHSIFQGLCSNYPQYEDVFTANLSELCTQLDALQAYGENALCGLTERRIITFHDGFSYFAESFDLLLTWCQETLKSL